MIRTLNSARPRGGCLHHRPARKFCCRMAFSLPALPYDYGTLEPYIDKQTMQIHHDKHHATYVNNLNAALAKAPDLKDLSIVDLNKAIGSSRVPSEIATAVRYHVIC